MPSHFPMRGISQVQRSALFSPSTAYHFVHWLVAVGRWGVEGCPRHPSWACALDDSLGSLYGRTGPARAIVYSTEYPEDLYRGYSCQPDPIKFWELTLQLASKSFPAMTSILEEFNFT